MKHVIACQEPGTNNHDRWVMIAGEPDNWGPPSNAIYRGGLLEDAVNGLIQARFLHDLVELVAEDGGYDVCRAGRGDRQSRRHASLSRAQPRGRRRQAD